MDNNVHVRGYTDRSNLSGSTPLYINNYFSVLVTGSDDPTDIGKIYQHNCFNSAGTATRTVEHMAGTITDEVPILYRNVNCASCEGQSSGPPDCSQGNTLYSNIINKENVVSLGNEDNENNKYGIVLNWQQV